ncbi:uncharacterized protein EV154DRAFT_522467 [Mucor mucedo]|uniref:uncharacterized protein n=1 Tax=Mucor mucedo TaxID=29922 RepID=UPI00221F8AFA|nr:uncharacterized protein EV154DRAFT_522467 [Mucor mucedo]KAI7883812.1 hypothetical protein EV154DRAFT_522467 [Mucor mucedo]
MAYSRSPPQSPSSPEDWLSRGPQSIKTYSTSSSRSHASRSQSLASASNRAFNSANYESTARVYFLELKSYLRELLAQEASEGAHPQRVAARQKLTRLSNLQFHELAMDVYDEVVRRNKNDKFLPFLAVKEEFHPKRNQARQKLATLPVGRFQDLASDVYYELTRRYTALVENEEPESPPPIPQIPPVSYSQPSKSTNIIPVKGMISVENLDDDTFNKGRSPTEQKDYFSNRSTANSSGEIEKIKSDYEYQINIMTNRIQQLQADISERDDKKGMDQESNIRTKQKEEQDQKMIRQMEEQYKKLDDKYKQLDRDYTKQQEAVRDVKNETKQMLDELKRLAKINDELLSEKEKSDAQILKLEAELKDWQMKYDKTRIELRSIKASSMIETDGKGNLIKENFIQPSKDGFISQDHILTYQASIDDLLLSARSSNPAQVINVMKNIVTVCRSITEEIEAQEGTLFTESRNSLYELKTSFSVSLSDLLVAAKYHASGMGISPVSLLDRSAGHLTSVIVDLIKLLGMKSSNDYNDRSDTNSYYGSMLSSNKPSKNSTYSSHEDTRSQLDLLAYKQTNGYSPKSNSNYSPKLNNAHAPKQSGLTPEELVKYLKTETDNIVQTIQNLLGALRLTQQNGEVHTIISSIVKIVATISELVKATCQSSSGYAYRHRCDPLLNQLSKCSERLTMIQGRYFVRGATATANAKRDLAKEAYEIAKITKELITLFESPA